MNIPKLTLAKKITVEKGLPIPGHKGRGVDEKYPWAELHPGDSFFVPNRTAVQFASTIQSARNRKQYRNWTFASRSVVNNGIPGVRVWRVK